MRRTVIALVFGVALAGTAAAQSDHEVRPGAISQITVHGASLEGNLEGNDPNRAVTVYLPPGYREGSDRRYPVVYFLHGFGQTTQSMTRFLGLQAVIDQAIADGAGEMIVVLPDTYTKYSGSMYSNSPTIGDWESFIADDLVAYIDAHYRTIAHRDSRGLAGHSMGGYGTMRIGMKRPDRFSAMYAMSSCCLMNEAPSLETVEEQLANNNEPSDSGFANVTPALAAAWAPNPGRPPHYFDWPYENGEKLPLVADKWIANSPLVMVDQFVPNLKRYDAIFLDVGDADGLNYDNKRLSDALTRLGIEHEFELYEGDHINRIAERFGAKLIPFFADTLEFD